MCIRRFLGLGMKMWPLRFRFLDPGPLVDQDLQLIQPESRFIDDVLAACRHPKTLSDAPEMARVTRQGLLQFLESAPMGLHRGELSRGKIPSYHFWMRLTGPDAPVKIAGGIGLRISNSNNVKFYIGHLGYNVYPPARGRHLAERACRLLFPLARKHGLKTLWITANPDNLASRRTCQRLGAIYVDTVAVPPTHELHARGESQKCRYRVEL
jgi:tagatose 1,6-diphosphate aldolase